MADYVTPDQVTAAVGGVLPAGVPERLAATATASLRAVIVEKWTSEDPPGAVPASIQTATLNIATDIYRTGTGGGTIDLDVLTSIPAAMTQALVHRQRPLWAPWANPAVMLA